MRRCYESIKRSRFCCCCGLALAFVAGLFLARRMVGADPGVARGRGAHRRAAISTSASRSRPATSSKRWPTSSTTWPGKLEESYADLEKKVEDRTHELTESLEQQTATVGGAAGDHQFAGRA